MFNLRSNYKISLMVFKDRQEAAEKLFNVIKKSSRFLKNKPVVVSLLRGGVVLGDVLSKKLKSKHLGLVVAKIPAPFNPELALGALCFDITYLEKGIVDQLKLTKNEIANQVILAERKFMDYCQRFGIKEKDYAVLKEKSVILVDDGIATGASAKAAALFCKSKAATEVALCVPVAPSDFETEGFDKVFILHKDPGFHAVSQYYDFFPQIEDPEVKKLLHH